MTYYPIPFSNAMVLALDYKTQTRRTNPKWGKLKPGDRLWVKESIYKVVTYMSAAFYGADTALVREWGTGGAWEWPAHWTRDTQPPMFMPQIACRTILEVEEIRAEHLQDITDADARAEGVGSVLEFQRLWESLHGPGSWDDNPELWVILFRRLRGWELDRALKELKELKENG